MSLSKNANGKIKQASTTDASLPIVSTTTTTTATTTNNKKKHKLDLETICDTAFSHYQTYLESCQPDNPDGDSDELMEILQVLQCIGDDKTKPRPFCRASTREIVLSRPDLLPCLKSVAATLLADQLIDQYLVSDDSDASSLIVGDDKDELETRLQHYLQTALTCMPNNASALSISANLARMTQTLPLKSIAHVYQHAAYCANELREWVIDLLDDDNNNDDNDKETACEDAVKEWLEAILLHQVVGVELLGGDDDDDEEEVEEQGEESLEKTSNSSDGDSSGEHWSASAVESTARFMAATLLSMLNEHELAKQQLSYFDLTHRIHPNVWQGKCSSENASKLSPVDPNNLEPAVFPGQVLPDALYQRLCHVFAPNAVYWSESGYNQRGYYSYFSEVSSERPAENLIDDAVLNHILPLVKERLSIEQAESIVGYEWWIHTRPLEANLGHNLHFDTDEAMLSQELEITHPIISGVMYLTGDVKGGPTFILDQTPDATTLPDFCWSQTPSDNSLLIFPGNLLHGVLPCPGSLDKSKQQGMLSEDTSPDLSSLWDKPLSSTLAILEDHRLTLLVGFWTRNVPEKMKMRSIYGPCGSLPPMTEEHTWVTQLSEGYEKDATIAPPARCNVKAQPVMQISPAWEALSGRPSEPPLELPHAIDHRFFVKDAPKCFRDSLFERDEFDDDIPDAYEGVYCQECTS